MPLSELTELVARLERADLELASESAALARRMDEIGAALDNLGAASSAAQLGLAASLLVRAGRAPEDEDEVLPTVRRLVGVVEQAFHVPVGAGPRPAREKNESSAQSSGRLAVRLHVARDMLLGEMLVHFGVVEPEQITAALQLQQGTDRRLGDILVEQKFTTQEEIQRTLAYQERLRGHAQAQEPRAPVPAGRRSAPAPEGEKRRTTLRMATELLLGEILVLQDVLTRSELDAALAEQRRSGQLLGETLQRMGLATRRQIQGALTVQGRNRRARSRLAAD